MPEPERHGRHLRPLEKPRQSDDGAKLLGARLAVTQSCTDRDEAQANEQNRRNTTVVHRFCKKKFLPALASWCNDSMAVVSFGFIGKLLAPPVGRDLPVLRIPCWTSRDKSGCLNRITLPGKKVPEFWQPARLHPKYLCILMPHHTELCWIAQTKAFQLIC